MKKLELKIIPPAVAFGALLLMWLHMQWLSASPLSLTTRATTFVLLEVLGAVVALTGIVQFRRLDTTPKPQQPEKASVLVTHGIYRYTRNPMYLGLAFTLSGLALLLGHVVLLIWVGAFVAYLTQFQIKPEERALATKFPQAFAHYQRQTRRWL